MTNKFRLIVAGGRDYTNFEHIETEILKVAEEIGEDRFLSIVSGKARGVDMTAFMVAKKHNIVCHEFPANWDKYGKSAGFRRNAEMGDFADGLLAFWDGKSRGTLHMIEYTQKLDKPVSIIRY